MGLLSQQHQRPQKWRGEAMTSLILTSQFFAMVEANYPETMKNLIVVRGEPMTGMSLWGGRSGEQGRRDSRSAFEFRASQTILCEELVLLFVWVLSSRSSSTGTDTSVT